MNIKCTRCSFFGDISNFMNGDKACKMCSKCRQKNKEYDENRKKSKKKWRKEYMKTDEYKENRKAQSKRHYLKHKDKVLNKNKVFALNNKNDLSEYISSWRKNNKDKIREYAHRRRMKTKNNGRDDLTSGQIQKLFDNHPYCEYCDSKEGLCLDHIIPISRDGENTLSNVTVACKICNSSKHAIK